MAEEDADGEGGFPVEDVYGAVAGFDGGDFVVVPAEVGEAGVRCRIRQRCERIIRRCTCCALSSSKKSMRATAANDLLLHWVPFG